MSLILAIDPGSAESGWCIIEQDTRLPVAFDKSANDELLARLWDTSVHADGGPTVIEMMASYGMPVGATTFETCVWIGRFYEAISVSGPDPQLIKRQLVKLHHCHNPRANDTTIRQALVDRFAKGQPNHGKGTKAQPGWFYGFRADVWQAYALAVYAADQPINGDRDHTD